MVTLTLTDSGSPKKRLVDIAFEECGISDYDAEQAASALRKLDSLMLEYPFDQLGYVPATYGTGSLEELTGFDPRWDQAVALSLAQRLAPKELNGTPLSGDSKAALARSMSLLYSYVAIIPSAIMVSAPAGEGNRRYGRSPYIHETE